jgi:hypothetical protein
MKIQERIYRILLKAYPAAFQREYGESMTQLFHDQLKDAIAGRKLLSFWKRIIVDLFRTAPYVQIRTATTTVVTIYLTYVFARMRPPHFLHNDTSFVARMNSLAWPASLMYEIGYFAVNCAFILLPAFCVFLILADRLSWRRLFAGVLAALPAFAFGRLAWIIFTLWRPAAFLEQLHLISAAYFVRYVTQWMPLYAGLAVAIWTARSSTFTATTDPTPAAEPHSL